MSDTNRITVIDPERRETAEHGTMPVIAIGVIMAVAAGLRFWSLGGGLPSSLGVDEPQIMVRSVAMVKSGDFHPHFFDYPGLYLYLQAAVVVARFLAGAAAGTWSSLSQVSDHDFYLWGRAVTAAFGTATVFLVYRAGVRWGFRQGLLAAAILAVMPIHVRESHFVLTDVPMTSFVALTLVLALRALETRSAAAFAWAGAAAGLATGTKYTAWVSVLMPLVAAGFSAAPFSTRVRNAAATLAGAIVAFVVVAPYTLLDLPGFLDGFGALAAAVPRRPPSAEPGWVVYLKHLRLAAGWPGLLLGGAGLATFMVGVIRGPSRARFAMVLLFLAVFWSTIIDRTLIFARYLMPALPLLCLAMGTAVIVLVDWIQRRKLPAVARTAVVVALVAAPLVQPTVASVGFDRQMGREPTSSLAIAWIEQNVKPGSRVIHEGASLHFPAGRYQLEYVHSVTNKGLDFYLGGNVDYVIATSAVYGRFFAEPKSFPAEYLAYRNLFQHLTPAFTAEPSPEHPGPEIRIFNGTR